MPNLQHTIEGKLSEFIGEDESFVGIDKDNETYIAWKEGIQYWKEKLREQTPTITKSIIEEVVKVFETSKLPTNGGEDGTGCVTLMYIENEGINIEVNKRINWIIKSLTEENI